FEVTRFGLLQSMGNDVEISDRTIGQQQPMLTVEIRTLLFGLSDDVPDEGSVVRMSALQHEFDRRLTGAAAVEDAERLLRPVDLPAGHMPAETAGPTQWLSRGQVDRATPQLFFRPLASGDVGNKPFGEKEPAGVVTDGPGTGQHPDPRAVLAIELQL